MDTWKVSRCDGTLVLHESVNNVDSVSILLLLVAQQETRPCVYVYIPVPIFHSIIYHAKSAYCKMQHVYAPFIHLAWMDNIWLGLYMMYQTTFLMLPARMLYTNDLPPASSVLIACEQVFNYSTYNPLIIGMWFLCIVFTNICLYIFTVTFPDSFGYEMPFFRLGKYSKSFAL